MEEPPDPALLARVAALRRLAANDVVPAVHKIVQMCSAGTEVKLSRKVAGPGRLVGYTKDVRLQFEPLSDVALTVHEASVVFGATAASMPAITWRGKQVVELGCGVGFVGVLLAALGARVVLSDLPKFEHIVTSTIALNAPVIRAPASASFCALDWTEPRMLSPLCDALRDASIVVASEPVVDLGSQQNFIAMLHALLGLDGEPPICHALQKVIVSHKHQQTFCISGYVAPSVDARPAITDADECDKCLFRRALQDSGLECRPWHPAPIHFEHPFVECWSISVTPAP